MARAVDIFDLHSPHAVHNAPVDSGEATVHRITAALRSRGPALDRDFDQFLPPDLRLASPTYWSRLAIARRASEWIDELGIQSVVDVGSGAGKFCVAAALAGDATYVGVEQRSRLVHAARRLADVFGVANRAAFIHGTFGRTPLPTAEAYYLFNPFGENVFGPEEHLDSDVELSEARYLRDITAAEEFLGGVSRGTYLLTYNGFGGQVPPTFREIRIDRELPNVLHMWQMT
jgi:predicted RNA methylase